MARWTPWMLSGVLLVGAAPAWAQGSAPSTVTFSKDVAPIFQAKCQSCHQPDSIAPMSLDHLPGSAAVGPLDQGPRRHAARCRRGTSTRSVGVQKFKNDMSLSDEQIDTIVAWVDAGAPQGDPKDLPPAKPLVDRQRVAGRARTASARPTSSSSRRSTRCRP